MVDIYFGSMERALAYYDDCVARGEACGYPVYDGYRGQWRCRVIET
jgi:hypothetical protein